MPDTKADKPDYVQPRVQSRLLRVFVLQLALISLVTIAGILAASVVAERILVNQALEGEANYYWNRRLKDPEFSLPDTLNLQSWLEQSSEVSSIPVQFEALPVGQHRVMIDGDDRIVHVSEREGQRLFLLFQDETVSSLAFYFGVVPLTLVLLFMYSLAFLTYWLSKRAVSPIVQLAEVIKGFDFNARQPSELDLRRFSRQRDSETQVLAQALEHFVKRSNESIERERNFTRYASHELRTPVAVIQGSVASLELHKLEGAAGRAISRIKRSSHHMGQLIASLLLLAREDANFEADDEEVNVNQIVSEVVDEITALENKDDVSLQVQENVQLDVIAEKAAVSIVIGNIIRNAWKYTDEGTVSVGIFKNRVVVTDTGRGLDLEDQRRVFEPFYRIRSEFDPAPTTTVKVENPPIRPGSESQGLGLGLAIVKHFCEHYGWTLELTSELGKGSEFQVYFNHSQ